MLTLPATLLAFALMVPEAPAALTAHAVLKKLDGTWNQPLYLSGKHVVEKTGAIKVIGQPQPFASFANEISLGAEQGLLGFALHPKYAENKKYYVDFTDKRGDTRIVEMSPSGRREILMIKQPYANHNGGHLAFGPDGKLYVGTGDGGWANDPHGNGQNKRALLAKMLRIDVDAAKPEPEIIQIGLRNPWRYSFDRKTGDLYIADVGQDKWEEIDVAPAGKLTGLNFGWNIMEGAHCFRGPTCDQSGLTLPVVEYDHKQGCSVTGGYVYRGKALPELDGFYFYSDFCTGMLRGFRWQAGKVIDHYDFKRAIDPENKLAKISSFGEDADGELYVLSLEGVIWKLTRK
jgi:glucose/arabinose dehydrogenase